MSVEQTETRQTAGGFEQELREALIAYCRLSEEAVGQIDETMRGARLGFAEAAVHAGLVTEREANEASAWAHSNLARRHADIVETALRRANSRQVTLRHAGTGKPSSSLILAHEINNPRSEQLRALRTELLLLDEANHQAGCITLVSPCAREGRSLLAAELAIAFSQLGRPTLLVDADLRNPSQHLLFGAEYPWGLAQALTYGEPPRLLGVEGLPFLSVLTAGPPVPNPLELLSGRGFEHLVQRWRRDYDFVVFDSPPASDYADALNVAAVAGSAVLVCRAQATPFRSLKSLLQRLGLARTRLLGTVVSEF